MDVLSLFRDKLAPSRKLSFEGSRLVDLLNAEDGWDLFLHTLGPKSFTKDFAFYHVEFWDWYWKLTKLRRDKKSLSREKLTFLAGWPRGGAKSTNVEWACLTEGAVGLPGYVLYVSLTQTSANSHVGDIRKRLESDEVARYFPDLAEPLIGRHGNQYGWKQDFLMTKGGWAIRPIGLDVAVRGFREGDLRPTMIVFDDIDDHNLTHAAVQQNLNIISRSIIPSGTPDTIHFIAQNLIAEHCAVNQIYTGETDILSDHIASVHKAFDELEINKIIDDDTGKSRYEIIHCVPTWDGMDLDACRINLNKSGIEAFYAEYQHDFRFDQSENVIPEFDEELHVISWTQFNEMFRTQGRIPKHWQAALGLDIGYTAEHQSAWTWLAVSAEDSDLPYAHFVYRGMTFTGTSLTDQVEEVLKAVTYRDHSGNIYDERTQYVVSKMSHEKLGERMILNREHDFQFSSAQFGKEDGIPQWRSLLRVDRTKPHPFRADYKDENGFFKFGRPSLFYVVADDELVIATTDRGLATHRAQTAGWKRRKVKLTSTGIQSSDPMKYKDDANDSFRMLLAEEFLTATPLTDLQRKRAALKDKVRSSDLTLERGRADYTGILMRRQMEIAEVEREARENRERLAQTVVDVLSAPPISKRFRV